MSDFWRHGVALVRGGGKELTVDLSGLSQNKISDEWAKVVGRYIPKGKAATLYVENRA